MDSADQITVELVPAATDDVQILIGELDRILSAEYMPEQRHGLTLEQIFKPDIRLFLARLDDLAAGCGGVAFFADFAEVKRMYVREVARGRGVARADRERGARRGICCAQARDRNASDRSTPFLRASRISPMRGVRRLRHNGTGGRRHQRFPAKAALRVTPSVAGPTCDDVPPRVR